jgi:hypothetical protein
MPPHLRNPLFTIVLSALLGSYGLTFIAISVLLVLFYVLHELRLT